MATEMLDKRDSVRFLIIVCALFTKAVTDLSERAEHNMVP